MPQVLLLSSAHASSQTIAELHQVSTEEFVTKDSTSGSAVSVGTPQVHGYRTTSTVTSSALGPINLAPHPSVFSGHGESAAGKVLKMLRLFLVQSSSDLPAEELDRAASWVHYCFNLHGKNQLINGSS
ncbi:uncharacterized protein [Dermacentor albipictus]|uniref:uncharacterized protein n=1 Tax=Dermacentor albipictus TaxID=60249 RepID=UPI0038FD27AB